MNIILLSYLSRSGSTLICDILMKDSRFCVCPEAEILTHLLLKHAQSKLEPTIYKKLNISVKQDIKLSHWNIKMPPYSKKDTNINLFTKIVTQYALKHNPKAEYLVFKSERLEGFQLNRYNNFYKIILFRDPRAIFLSQKNSTPSLGVGKMNVNPRRLVGKMNKLLLSYNTQEKKMVYVQYELFLFDKESQIKKILSMLGIMSLKISDEGNSILNIMPNSQKHLHKNINKKGMVSSIDKWKKQLSEYEIEVIQKNMSKVLDLGYKSYPVIISRYGKIKNYILIEIKDIINKILKGVAKIVK